jgi:hypothetical protein
MDWFFDAAFAVVLFFSAIAGTFFDETGFLAAFFTALASRADGSPVFFSRAMNLPREVFTRSGTAAMSSGCGPA